MALSNRIRHFDGALSSLVGVAAFVVYAWGACQTIYVGDSGELATAALTLGIPHPSGYPLYVLLGKLWTVLLPVGSVAYRLSLFSAACAATTVGLLCWLCRRLGLHWVAAVCSALLVGFAPSFWSQANVQRVYSLNALFVVLATTAALAWYRERKTRFLVLGFFLCGLGASNHTFMAVYAAAMAVFFVLSEPDLLRSPRSLLIAAGGFGVGLLPYLYLPLRSRANPLLDWGNPETLSDFLKVVLRRDFWGRAWIEGPADLPIIVADYLQSLGSELLWVGTAFAVLGVLSGRRRRWPISLPLLVMAVNLGILALHGSRSDIFIWHRYYVPSYLMAGLLGAMGCHVLLERIPARFKLLPLAIPVLALLVGWRDFDRSRYRIAEDFSRSLLDTLPPGAHLSASDDNILFVLIYLHLVEGARPDINLILQGVDDELPPLRFNPDDDPLFFTHHPNWNIEGLEVLPVGLVFKTVRSGQSPPPVTITKEELEGENDPRVPKDYLTQNLIGHFHFMLGTTYEWRDWPRAWRQFKIAEAAAAHNDVLFYNLGLIYRRNGLFEEALAAFERSHSINSRHIASKSRVEASDRIEEVQGELARLQSIESELSGGLVAQGIKPGSSEFHLRMAQWLDERGQSLAARGHRLQASLEGLPFE